MTRLIVAVNGSKETYEIDSHTILSNGNLQVSLSNGTTHKYSQGTDWKLEDV